MTTEEENPSPLYEAYSIRWNRDDERYHYEDDIIWEGKSLTFDTYQEFLDFMNSLSPNEKLALDIWRIENTETGEYLMVSDGLFDDVSFLSIHAQMTEN